MFNVIFELFFWRISTLPLYLKGGGGGGWLIQSSQVTAALLPLDQEGEKIDLFHFPPLPPFHFLLQETSPNPPSRMPLVRTVRSTRDTEDVFLCHTSFFSPCPYDRRWVWVIFFEGGGLKLFFKVSQLSQKVYLEWSTFGRKKCFVFLGGLFSPNPHKPASQKHCWCSKSDSPILSSLSGTLCCGHPRWHSRLTTFSSPLSGKDCSRPSLP